MFALPVCLPDDNGMDAIMSCVFSWKKSRFKMLVMSAFCQFYHFILFQVMFFYFDNTSRKLVLLQLPGLAMIFLTGYLLEIAKITIKKNLKPQSQGEVTCFVLNNFIPKWGPLCYRQVFRFFNIIFILNILFNEFWVLHLRL